MSTREMQLLSRVIRTGELNVVVDWGITSDDFLTSEGRMLFDLIRNYHALPGHRGAVIGENALRARLPQFQLCDDAGMTAEALCAEVRKRRLTISVRETANKMLELADINPMTAINEGHSLINGLQALGLSKSTDISFLAAMDSIILEYEAREQGLTSSKVSWPWEIMNEMTGGLQEDDYIVLYGRPKSMKSWTLAALIAHCVIHCVPVLVYTKEMTPKNIVMRVAGIVMSVAYQELRMGTLSVESKQALYDVREMMRDLSQNKNFTVLSGQDVSGGGDTIGWLHAKVEKYKPEVVFVDGLYLMSDGSKKAAADWTRVTSVSRAARQMQLATRVPLIATVQANRSAAKHSGAEFDEIAYADAIGQDATIAARVIADKHQPTISVVLAGSREFKLHGFRIGGVPCTDFSYKEVLTEKDIEKAKKDDHSEREPDSVDQHAKERKRAVRAPQTGAQEKQVQEQLNGIHTI